MASLPPHAPADGSLQGPPVSADTGNSTATWNHSQQEAGVIKDSRTLSSAGGEKSHSDVTVNNHHQPLPAPVLHNDVVHERSSGPGRHQQSSAMLATSIGGPASASMVPPSSSSVNRSDVMNQHLHDSSALDTNVGRVPGSSSASGCHTELHVKSEEKEDILRSHAHMKTDSQKPGPCDLQAALDRKATKTGSGDYERLHRGRPSTPHVYYPLSQRQSVGQSRSASQGRSIIHAYPNSAPNTTTTGSKARPAPTTGATSPLYESRTARYPPRPEARPLMQQPGRKKGVRVATDHDEIIELSSDVGKGPRSAEEKDNSDNDKKDETDIRDIPNTNFAIACMVALCFNLPFGVLAMYLSLRAVKAFQDGQPKLGEKRSRWSIVVSLLGITITTVIISSVVLYIAMQGQRRISRHKAYGAKGGLNL